MVCKGFCTQSDFPVKTQKSSINMSLENYRCCLDCGIHYNYDGIFCLCCNRKTKCTPLHRKIIHARI